MAHVLLVEDDPDQLELRKTILTHAGHDVETATNLPEALARCDGCEIVVMDLIPDCSELIQRLDPRKRIIVLTGREAHSASIPRPVDAFLVKPCPARKLLELIAQLCLLLWMAVVAHAQAFHVSKRAEVVADLDLV